MALRPPPELTLRTLRKRDLPQIKELHAVCFPIRYEERFFQSLLLPNSSLSVLVLVDECYSSLKNGGNSIVAAFVVARFTSTWEPEDNGILSRSCWQIWGLQCGPLPELLHVMTLGVHPNYRRRGLASRLLRQLKIISMERKQCHAIYLHVLDSNKEAIALYETNNFERVRLLKNYYHIDGRDRCAYLYVLHIKRTSEAPLRFVGSIWKSLFCGNNCERFKSRNKLMTED